MSRRLEVPGERSQAGLLAACEAALARQRPPGGAEPWPEPDSYAAAALVLLGLTADPQDLAALWLLQNADGGFPLSPGAQSDASTSAMVWAAMQLSGSDSARLRDLSSWIRRAGGVAALPPDTRLEWALIGILPPELASDAPSPAAQILRRANSAGGPQRRVPLEPLGPMPASPPAARAGSSWWKKFFGPNPGETAASLARRASSGCLLSQEIRIAWLAAVYAGLQPALPALRPGGEHEAMPGGIEEICARQGAEGQWSDGEGAIHGSWQALEALRRLGYGDREAEVLRAGEWLRSAQNADGGWGEAPDGGAAESTVSHTAWALMGLIAGGDPASESVTKAVEFLLAAQASEGAWRERAWTRVVLPGRARLRDQQRAAQDARSALESYIQAVRHKGTEP